MNLTLRNLLVAAVLMVAGVILVTSFIRGERRELSRGQQQVEVFIAKKDIPPGTSAKDLESGGYIDTKEMLRKDQPPEAVGAISSLEGLVSNETVYKDEVISRIAFDRTAGLKPAAQIKGNERLFSLAIPPANDVASMVRPGNRIDIYAVLDANSGQGKQMTVVARDIEVMSTPTSLTPEEIEVDPAAPEAKGDDKLYVLKATDRQIADIVFAQSASDGHGLTILLRPDNGDTSTNIPTITGPRTVSAAAAEGSDTP
ncbi:MAG: putative flp pilus assembly protein CpaB [Thermoleophilia bacterium]|nr:putative flp pilus assembly protein CpaB [Thermoleophilia bacterium]MCZ4495895.1 putative flp pilus assembly protein CpaB [Thermoleophilia bacterium]